MNSCARRTRFAAARGRPEPIDLAAWRALFQANCAEPDRRNSPSSVCRCYPRKRLSVLLAAAQRLRQRTSELELRIVGSGPATARWRAMARRCLGQEMAELWEVGYGDVGDTGKASLVLLGLAVMIGVMAAQGAEEESRSDASQGAVFDIVR